MTGSDALTNPVGQIMECHMEKIDDECRLERMFERQARTDGMVHTKNDGMVLTKPKPSPSECDSKKKSCINVEKAVIRNLSRKVNRGHDAKDEKA